MSPSPPTIHKEAFRGSTTQQHNTTTQTEEEDSSRQEKFTAEVKAEEGKGNIVQSFCTKSKYLVSDIFRHQVTT